MRIVVIDPRRTATCEGADLHLPLAPGSDVALFTGLLAQKDVRRFDVLVDHAEAVGGVKLLSSIAGPLPDLVFCPTGGIDLAKAPSYLALANVKCVGGSWMLPKAALEARDYAKVETLAREAAGLKSA